MGSRTASTTVDLDALSYDLSDLFDKYRHEYPLPDLDVDEIREALPLFLAAMGLTPDGHRSPDAVDAPQGTVMKRTQHTCNNGRGPFGRKTPGCPRCDELLRGALPREAPEWVRKYLAVKDTDPVLATEIKAHFGAGGRHTRGQCGTVCTAFDW